MDKSLQNLYAKNLQQPFGYPLRFPEPTPGLPGSYAEHGLHIGDVGYVNNVGMFEVLFNICFSAQHDLHRGKDLTNLQVGLTKFNPHEIPVIPDGIPSGRAICYGIQRLQGEALKRTQCAPCEFISSSTSGAILILPSGAILQNLSDSQEAQFRMLAKEHALKWSRFAGRQSLYLITGLYKTSSWRLASFHDIRPVRQVLLKCDETGGYTWHSGCDYRQSMENCKENQTVFISGFKIEVRGSDEHPVVEKLSAHSRRNCELWKSLLDMLVGFWWMASRSMFNLRDHGTPEDIGADVHVDSVPTLSQPFHPSDIINRYQLNKSCNARVAITHDRQWLSMLKKHELSYEDMLDEKRFWTFLEEKYTYDRISDNVVYLRRKIDVINNGGDEDLHMSVHERERFVAPTPSHNVRQFGITHMRVENVVSCLERMPIGFYVLIQFDSVERRSKCKPASLCHHSIEWDDMIVLPTDSTIKTHFLIISSFEFQPMLGNGEMLCKLETTVGKLVEGGSTILSWGEKNSILITCEELRTEPPAVWSHGNMNLGCEVSLYSQVAKKTDKGHHALLCYRRGEGIERLKESVECFQLALGLCPPKHECYAAALFNHAMAMFINCQVYGATSDLDSAIDSYRKALELRLDRHPDRPGTLLHLAQSLLYRQGRLQRTEIVAGEIEELSTEIKQTCSESRYEHRAADLILQTLKRYQVLISGKLTELNELVRELEQSARIPPDWHFDRPHRLINYSVALRKRFKMTGDLGCLAKSISTMEGAVKLVSDSHFDKPWMLASLGDSLRVRFVRRGNVADLNSSISMIKDALKLTPDGHFDKPWMLGCLDGALRHSVHGGVLDDPISMVEDVVDLTSVLKLKGILTSGSFSTVYRCLHIQGMEVAVKAIGFPPGFDLSAKDEFIRKIKRELGIWKRLNHPNITPLLGTANGKDFGSDYPCMVSTLMANGTLFKYVEQRRTTLSLPGRIKLVKGSAAGLEYLHSLGIVHGDFHPANILIDGDRNPRLTDFGSSQVLCEVPGEMSYLYTDSVRPGAMLWAAPELIYPELYPKLKFQATLRSDIYSLGSTILFILSGQCPWRGRGEAENKLKEFQNPLRPVWPANMPDGVWDFIEQCWSSRDPSCRPSAQDVLSFSSDKLEQLLRPLE